ncbi:MAG: hypothetical protein K6B75_04505 [Lachnospiraceae bacterium]|nr:hypothetical protein [Lachnospiraceae bacterium]
MRIWAKIWKENHLLKDTVIENTDPSLTRTKKVFAAVEEVCSAFDLSKPIWLESNIESFKKYSKTKFTQDSFMEPVEFDFLELHVIEED